MIIDSYPLLRSVLLVDPSYRLTMFDGKFYYILLYAFLISANKNEYTFWILNYTYTLISDVTQTKYFANASSSKFIIANLFKNL